jgi:hypothetical protein
MKNVARDTESSGCVSFEHQDDDILVVRFIGDVSFEFAKDCGDTVIEQINNGTRRVLYNVAESNPLFAPTSLTDEVRRIGGAGNKQARFAYLAPENMFARHFMLIEAAAFNDGIQVKFFSDDAEARAWLTSP